MAGALLLLLNACANVPIEDEIAYGSLGSQGAIQCHTLATTPCASMTLAQFAALWDDLSDPLVALHASAFTRIKGDLEKLCTDSQVCSADTQVAIDTIYAKITAIESSAFKVNANKGISPAAQ